MIMSDFEEARWSLRGSLAILKGMYDLGSSRASTKGALPLPIISSAILLDMMMIILSALSSLAMV
jgi:hypothetical protein